MSLNLKTAISSTRSILDEQENYMPMGNYYFLIKEMKDNLVLGDLSNQSGKFGEFIFTAKNVIKMMAVAQSRLARRANITDEDIPNYISPVSSPKNVKTQLPIVNNFTMEENKKPEEDKCIICLDIMNNATQLLLCGHKYHKKCIDNWKNQKNTCPCCRKPIVYLNPTKNKLTPFKHSNYVIKANNYTEGVLTREIPSINTIIRRRERQRRNTISSETTRRYNLRSRNSLS